MWRQTRDPSLDPYIIQPNGQGGTYTLTDWFGWCLAYVQTALGTGWGGNTAWECWEAHTVNRHEDYNLPGGVYVPIFFSGYHGLGHTAIYKDGEVWSSPVSHKPYADTWGSIAEVERAYGVTFVGWAEGIGGATVVENVPDAPPSPPYTISAMEPKQLHVKPNMHKWNLAQPTFADVCNNPITTTDAGGLSFTAVATLTRSDAGFQGYTYYLEDANTPHGWNSLDCEDVVVAAPSPPPRPLPAAPVNAPPAKKYTVLTTIMHFDTAQDATFHSAMKGTINPGEYFQFDLKEPAVQLGTDNQHPLYWVNTKDNVAPIPDVTPATEPATVSNTPTGDWKSTFSSFPDGKSRRYVARKEIYLFDLASAKAEGITIAQGEAVPIYGSVQKGGMTYLVPRLQADTVEGQIAPKEHWYGIPTTSVYTGLPNMQSQQYTDALARAENEHREYRKSVHHETTQDKVYYAEQLVARFVKDGGRFVDGIISGATIKKITAALKGQKVNKK